MYYIEEIGITLNQLESLLFYLMLFVGGIFTFILIKMLRFRHFLSSFEERYHLNEVSYDFSMPKEIEYHKWRILLNLARYHISPYWSSIRQRHNEKVINLYVALRDPYFMACIRLLNRQYVTKHIELLDKIENKDVLQEFISKKDWNKFLKYDRYATAFFIIGILGILICICYRFGIPILENHYWSLHWNW